MNIALFRGRRLVGHSFYSMLSVKTHHGLPTAQAILMAAQRYPSGIVKRCTRTAEGFPSAG